MDGDGIDEILTMLGPGEGSTADVKAWNVDCGTATAMATIDFTAYDAALKYGGRIAGGRLQ